jgi:hypothetical protein
MKISDIRLELELGGVDEADIAEIIALCESKGMHLEAIDDELLKRGYDKVFDVDYENYDDWDDDAFASVEPFPHKPNYRE